MNLSDVITQDEGFRPNPYLDCCGKAWRDCVCAVKGRLTIGVGRDLDDVGISQEEAFLMRDNDLMTARREASKYAWFKDIDPVRQDIIVQMIFNMGAPKFAEFKRMFAALDRKDFDAASSEMLNSRWSSEVGNRATRLAGILKSGIEAQ